MNEYVRRQYLKEEDFLEEYLGTVDAVLPQLPHAWQPNFQCDDRARFQRGRLRGTGQLASLPFDSAVLFYGRDGLSSIGLYLRSSERFVVARIHFGGGRTAVDVLADVPARPFKREPRR